MQTFEIDQRVAVTVADPSEWNRDVLDVLQGMHGKVIAVKTTHDNGKAIVPLDVPRYCVAFDHVTARTSRGQSYSYWWLDATDLTPEIQDAQDQDPTPPHE